MSILRRIEKAMDHRLRAIFAGGSDEPGAREAIELYCEALDLIAARVSVGKRSERLVPVQLHHHRADGEESGTQGGTRGAVRYAGQIAAAYSRDSG